MSFLNKIFGDPNQNYLDKLNPTINKINSLEKKFEVFSNEELKKQTERFKADLKTGSKLDDFLPEAFALVREAAKRTLRQRHFDVQLMGGIVLHQGKVAEMKTGEGKTLAATLAVYLNALSGKGVHVVTVNDYLAKRDTVWMGQIYYALGLSIGCIVHEQAYLYDPSYKVSPKSKGQISNQIQNPKSKNGEKEIGERTERDKERDLLGGFRIVYSYLRPVSRKQAYAADVTYGTNNEFGFDYLRDNMVYDLSQKVQRGLNFAIVDEADSILIDEARTPLIISAPDVESSKMYKEFAKIIPHLDKNHDYEVDEKMKTVTLTEEGIDRVESILGAKDIYEERGIKYLHHLEQALKAQVLFKRDRDYVVKNGQIIIVDEFTGRLLPGRRYSGGLHQAIEAKEGLPVQAESVTLASISFQNYFRLYKKLSGMTGTALTSAEEFDKVYGLDVIAVPTNRPMIRKDLPDVVFKNERGKYKAIVKKIKECYQSGQPILVGTRSIEKNEYLGKLLDIEGVPHKILNAKHHEQEGEIIAQAGRIKSVTIATNMAGRGVDIVLGGNPPNKEEAGKVKELGGLFVLGTERHESRRIDNQLRGRAGRQGDPGTSQFFLSLEDDLMRIFGGDKIKSLMDRLNVPEDQPIAASIVSRAIESAQSKVEGMNFDARKHLLDYDDVMNKHREVFYKKRNEILESSDKDYRNRILEIVKQYGFSEEDYLKKEKEIGEENFPRVEKAISLKVLDSLWIAHLENMEALRDSVALRAYGQIDPLVAYRSEGHKMFRKLLNTAQSTIVHSIFNLKLRRRY